MSIIIIIYMDSLRTAPSCMGVAWAFASLWQPAAGLPYTEGGTTGLCWVTAHEGSADRLTILPDVSQANQVGL